MPQIKGNKIKRQLEVLMLEIILEMYVREVVVMIKLSNNWDYSLRELLQIMLNIKVMFHVLL